jgi:exopolysaccharide biosynthesis WecB/TagA/CpsF family protein
VRGVLWLPPFSQSVIRSRGPHLSGEAMPEQQAAPRSNKSAMYSSPYESSPGGPSLAEGERTRTHALDDPRRVTQRPTESTGSTWAAIGRSASHHQTEEIRKLLPTIEIFDLQIAASPAADMVERIRSTARSRRVRLAYVNAHTLNLAYGDPSLREALVHSDFVLNDGAGVSLAARLQGRKFPDNLQGTDFNMRLLKMSAAEGWSAFLLGGRPGVPEKAATEILRAIPMLRIAGTRHGFHHQPDLDVARVNASGAEVLLVAMGNPRQEQWLEHHFSKLPHVRLAAGVGAFLDFQAKIVHRAPHWMNICGIEWTYRLAQEPRRLAGRYLTGNPMFLARVIRERLQLASTTHQSIDSNGRDRSQHLE